MQSIAHLADLPYDASLSEAPIAQLDRALPSEVL